MFSLHILEDSLFCYVKFHPQIPFQPSHISLIHSTDSEGFVEIELELKSNLSQGRRKIYSESFYVKFVNSLFVFVLEINAIIVVAYEYLQCQLRMICLYLATFMILELKLVIVLALATGGKSWRVVTYQVCLTTDPTKKLRTLICVESPFGRSVLLLSF